jgi:hypothetical protein
LTTLRFKTKKPLLRLVILSQNTGNILRKKFKVSKRLFTNIKNTKTI